MRCKSVMALAAAATALGLALPETARAFGWHRHDGYDPYAYEYVPRRYYPYFNSGYWRSAAEMRARYRDYYDLPPYYESWGHPVDIYRLKRRHHFRHW